MLQNLKYPNKFEAPKSHWFKKLLGLDYKDWDMFLDLVLKGNFCVGEGGVKRTVQEVLVVMDKHIDFFKKSKVRCPFCFPSEL